MRLMTGLVLFLIVNNTVLAAGKRIAPDIEPLQHSEVITMIERINNHDEIELHKVYQSLVGPQIYLRALAATYLGEQGNHYSIPYLIDALQDCSVHVGVIYTDAAMVSTCYRANVSLEKLTGIDFGFIWDAKKGEREAIILKWQQWYQEGQR